MEDALTTARRHAKGLVQAANQKTIELVGVEKQIADLVSRRDALRNDVDEIIRDAKEHFDAVLVERYGKLPVQLPSRDYLIDDGSIVEGYK